MFYPKETAAVSVNVRLLTQFLFLAGTASLLPFFIHPQWITGPLVNAILILAVFITGMRSALLLCVIPSSMALAGGLLPVAMAPILPFIVVGNALLVLSVYFFFEISADGKKGYWAGLASGAALKFFFLHMSVSLLASFADSGMVSRISLMFGYSQLATALVGGMIAWGVLKWLKKI